MAHVSHMYYSLGNFRHSRTASIVLTKVTLPHVFYYPYLTLSVRWWLVTWSDIGSKTSSLVFLRQLTTASAPVAATNILPTPPLLLVGVQVGVVATPTAHSTGIHIVPKNCIIRLLLLVTPTPLLCLWLARVFLRHRED